MTRSGRASSGAGMAATQSAFLDIDDLSLDLQRENLWWNCNIRDDMGRAVSRRGSLHRRPPR